MYLYIFASFSIRGSINMQTIPASTHSRQLRDLIGYKSVCDVRNTSDFKTLFWDCLWFTTVL